MNTPSAPPTRFLPPPGNPWPRLPHSALALALVEQSRRASSPLLALVSAAHASDTLRAALDFFAPPDLPIISIPEREMLPYDSVSPAREVISRRLHALTRMPTLSTGIIIATADLVLERLPPQDWLAGAAFAHTVGDRIEIESFRAQLIAAGYAMVGEVRVPGEFALRGGVLDVFPSGMENPVRIDLFDDEIDSLRCFDPETQISDKKLLSINMMPAFEFPFDEAGIRHFRQAWRARFPGDPMAGEIYRSVSKGRVPPGIESWLPLFFDRTATLADYLPPAAGLIVLPGFETALVAARATIEARYESFRHDLFRPLLPPDEAFLSPAACEQTLGGHPHITVGDKPAQGIRELPTLELQPQAGEPLERFINYTDKITQLIFTCESPGRRETVREILARRGLRPEAVENWAAARASTSPLVLAVAALEDGFEIPAAKLAVVPDAAVFGARAATRRRPRHRVRDPASIIRDLTDLAAGTPVVHQDYGVGRFRGLVTRAVDDHPVEFVRLEYAGGDRLYVPVAALDRLSRYLGADTEHAPLTKLGSGQWERARRRAAARARDAAAELLELYAQREAREGTALTLDESAWERFVQAFPFDETPDQGRASSEVLADLTTARPMDRLVCGDVGFGKTEIALRAAFVAVYAGRQVAVLVPTTLLADQHYRSFCDRFADWPVRIELLSRFRSTKSRTGVLEDLIQGKVDIVIGTHALLGRGIRFDKLGLVIVDEEHRFGVRHKERLKHLRAEVDVLTLTATPIPRTLSMTLSGIRDLSIIATPPEQRLPIRTTISQWQDAQIRDAILRELRRGGQIFVVHNEVRSIGALASRIEQLVPEAKVRIGHGRIAERALEQLMLDFYHRRFDVLVATTIIESGIDIPTANTIVIHNAHRFGLAQLHQLRGRVGRSHHQAYAYLITPPEELLGRDAKARLEALVSLEELGAGFFLATQDLEIRGAGALLGDAQSGQLEEVGLDLYNRLLKRAITTLKAGGEIKPETELDPGVEVDLGAAALLPDDYIPDVHLRLVFYKRIANAESTADLEVLGEEIVDRFGTLPDSARRLLAVAGIKQHARRLGMTRIHAGPNGARFDFGPTPRLDALALIRLVQADPRTYRLYGEKRLELRRNLAEFKSREDGIRQVLDAITPVSVTAPDATTIKNLVA